ncbi:mitogen-activated protein kinase kinase kinase 7-like [Panulirus ornatus]|uniref:mitogen-activated protein kinase kinase kinase 7-like n=1 Tax=Panulirus ornatus TaxID=150431 RepID=UPI003A85C384
MITLHREDVASLSAQALEILGTGGNGTAYLVPWEDGVAVLKVSHKPVSRSMMKEAKYMTYLKGAGGVPRLYATCKNPTSIVMTFLGRLTLQDFLTDKDPTCGYDLLQLGLLVGERLQEMHKKGIIHNDLKTNNVIVGGSPREPEVSIIDLGLACFKHSNLRLTDTPGKFLWMAPEVRRGRPSTRSSDVYSYAYLLRQIFKEVFRSRRSRLATTVAEALSVHPGDRPTLREILKRLRYTVKKRLAARKRKVLKAKKPVMKRKPKPSPPTPVPVEAQPIKHTPHLPAKPVRRHHNTPVEDPVVPQPSVPLQPSGVQQERPAVVKVAIKYSQLRTLVNGMCEVDDLPRRYGGDFHTLIQAFQATHPNMIVRHFDLELTDG